MSLAMGCRRKRGAWPLDSGLGSRWGQAPYGYIHGFRSQSEPWRLRQSGRLTPWTCMSSLDHMKNGVKLWARGVTWVSGVLELRAGRGATSRAEESVHVLIAPHTFPSPQLSSFTLKGTLSRLSLLHPDAAEKTHLRTRLWRQPQERTEKPGRRTGCQGFGTLHYSTLGSRAGPRVLW